MRNNFIKILSLFLPLLLYGCYVPIPEELTPSPNFDTEVNCPRANYKVILLETTPADIRKAIDVSIENRNKYKTTENYTVLKLPNKKTFFIQGIIPENMRFCYLIAIPIRK